MGCDYCGPPVINVSACGLCLRVVLNAIDSMLAGSAVINGLHDGSANCSACGFLPNALCAGFLIHYLFAGFCYSALFASSSKGSACGCCLWKRS